ncbi:MAG: NAD(P)-binding protein [Acetobacter orientalis]
MKIVIVGAGMAGMACAQSLGEAGHAVTLFDKGRCAGGRMSTRCISLDGISLTFDHGAQYFTARGSAFREQVVLWHRKGIVAPWPAAADDAWVGTPGMNAPIAHMAKRQDVHFSSHVVGLAREGQQWQVLLQDGHCQGPYDAAILALPAEQAAAFLGAHDLRMAFYATAARSRPCWTALVAFEDRLPIETDVLRRAGPISWAARDSAKPHRSGAIETWVVQAGAEWSTRQLEAEPEEVAEELSTWLADQTGSSRAPPQTYLTAHRWRYAMTRPSSHGALWNGDLSLGACGDWLLGPRIELAWQSGIMLAERILA